VDVVVKPVALVDQAAVAQDAEHKAAAVVAEDQVAQEDNSFAHL
jgi:hypothetical protein